MTNHKPHILFVDDDPLLLESVSALLRKDFIIETSSSPYAALGILTKGKRFAAIVSDMRMPGMDGINFLKQAATIDMDAVRIMLTGHADLDTVMAAVNDSKVSHFLTKPCPTNNLREILLTCAVTHAERINEDIPEESISPSLERLIGISPTMLKFKSLLHRLAEVDSAVLFTGESGTGKSFAAEILHSMSRRRGNPFVRVNCPSLSEGLFEAELFGSVRGAYTGSIRDAKGRFMAAEGGSILLDEIGDIPLAMQSKLLHVIENKELERVGDCKTIKADVRIMTATNMDLIKLVETGAFRKDLYYRLNVMHLILPPLRERPEDIPLLSSSFLSLIAREHGVENYRLSDNAINALCAHTWPGNIRELRHILEHGATVCSGNIIQVEDLPKTVSADRHQTPYLIQIGMLEEEKLLNALKAAGWNKSRAARALGMSRSSLYRKLKEAGISPDEIMN